MTMRPMMISGKLFLLAILIFSLPKPISAQDTLHKKWQIGIGGGIQTVRMINLNQSTCIEFLKCPVKPVPYKTQYARAFSIELAYVKNDKTQYFFGFEGNRNKGTNDAYIYNETGITNTFLNYSETLQYSYSLYLGGRHFVLENKIFRPFYGLKLVTGNDIILYGTT